jgi:hypothetical protein
MCSVADCVIVGLDGRTINREVATVFTGVLDKKRRKWRDYRLSPANKNHAKKNARALNPGVEYNPQQCIRNVCPRTIK